MYLFEKLEQVLLINYVAQSARLGVFSIIKIHVIPTFIQFRIESLLVSKWLRSVVNELHNFCQSITLLQHLQSFYKF